ncbi:VanZ like family protein [Halogeometricum rufum]|uniref:VanZ like family protein n=1 Tax=Halogeometricum rufum TaxID=553469 RepID=A0A1I6G7Y5_9EURY|nr:VanZ family protein [Halogeometricum rufum]SFR38306.1 VanZ like family protein [Halogeometricum rufum]
MQFSRSVRTLVLVGWCVAVVVASVIPAPTGGVASPGAFVVGLDKLVHFGAYGVTAFLAAFALGARDARGLAVAVLAAVALGGGVELVQTTLPTRTFGLGDLVANAVGALSGALVYVAVERRVWVTDDE